MKIAGLDIGTTGCKLTVFDENGNYLGKAYRDYPVRRQVSGHEIDLMLTMNAREIVHFMKLRTCRRAQWEIRGVAWRMLEALRESCPEIFGGIGPSCVYGKCPEGRMSCGKPYKSIWEE